MLRQTVELLLDFLDYLLGTPTNRTSERGASATSRTAPPQAEQLPASFQQAGWWRAKQELPGDELQVEEPVETLDSTLEEAHV